MENFRITKPKHLNSLKVNLAFDIDSDYKVGHLHTKVSSFFIMFFDLKKVSAKISRFPSSDNYSRFPAISGDKRTSRRSGKEWETQHCDKVKRRA